MLRKVENTGTVYRRETVSFLGLDRADDVQEGECARQQNLSGRRYPYLAPRLPRSGEPFDQPDALFAWDGVQIVADNGRLLYDGEELYTLTRGAKQFAVVNTKLVVWPDRVAVDLTNRTVWQMEVEAVNVGTATFTDSTLTLEPSTVYSVQEMGYSGKKATVWTYGAVSWDAENGWTVEDAQASELFSSEIEGRYYIPNATYNESAGTYSVLAPEVNFSSSAPEETRNEFGVFGKFVDYALDYETAAGKEAKWTFHIYLTSQLNAPLDELFSVGDVVTVSGTLYGYMDRERRKITGIDTQSNTLTFADGTFATDAAIAKVSADIEDKYVRVRFYSDTEEAYMRYWVIGSDGFTTKVSISAGCRLVLDVDSLVLRVYDGEWNEVASHRVKYTTETSSDANQTNITMTALASTQEAVTVTREVPELDYICESENRLWGVSCKDKTIYASALGDPNNFYDYSGEAGSWSVAVGSEGDFTGICAYGGAVLCWKERTLHKVLGSLPSTYQTATGHFAGVRAGAHKSLVNINEALYYLGPDGVYAYAGNTPSHVSRALGADVLKDGVAGTDGRLYYLSVRNGEEWELLTYDTQTGLWMREDAVQAADFCRIDDKVRFLAGDTVYTVGDGTEAVEWEAELVPAYETLAGRTQYTRLLFRVQVPKGSWLAVDVCYDDGRWIQAGQVNGKGEGVASMPVPLRRCGKFEVRLRGKGECAVMEMAREFRVKGR